MIQQALNELSQQIRIRPKYDNFIGGNWVAPVKGQYFTNITPVTGKPICEIARSTAEDIELALDAAHKVREQWGRTAPAERAAVLLKIADKMEALDDIAVCRLEAKDIVRHPLVAEMLGVL